MKRLGMPMAGARVAIQGFGNVGNAAARVFHDAGARIVAIQDVAGSIVCEHGIDPHALSRFLVTGDGKLTDFPGVDTIDHDQFWGVPCDVLLPAALENQITVANAGHIRARLIV